MKNFTISSITRMLFNRLDRHTKLKKLIFLLLIIHVASFEGYAINASGIAILGGAVQATQVNTIASFTVPAGNNRLLLVTASDGLSTNITGVTFGGIPMTEKLERNDGTAVDAIYILVLGSSASPTSGSIVLTSTNTSSNAAKVLTARVIVNVDQTTPLTSMLTAQDSNTPSGDTLVVTSSTGDLVFDIFDTWRSSTGGSAHSTASGQTINTTSGELSFGGSDGYGYYSTSTKSGASNVSMGWSTTNHQALLHLAVNIKQAACNAPTVPTLTASSTSNCGTQSTTLNIASGSLNDASNWQWYSGTCGGTPVSSGTSIVVSPTTTTTYFARGEGGCVTPGSCGSITVNVTTPPACQNGGIVNASCACNCPPGFSGSLCQTALCVNTTGSTNVTACNNYIWIQNNNTNYTTSGNYVRTFTNAGGCDSVHTLHLTIKNASTNAPTVANVCNSYTWTANNVTYTSSGNYSASFTNAAGCDSTVTLNLTIRNASMNAPTVVNVCNSYTWTANNVTYTSSGNYSASFTNAAGCDSTVTLNLTIRNASMNTPTVTNVCNSYTWAANNVTYTSSGNYSASFTNAAGCDSTVTLNLTIRNASMNTPTVANVCNSYTWTANNVTYTSSGNYSASFTNAAGCDSTVTLNLTIRNASMNAPTVANVCNSYTWTANNVTYTSTGNYSASFTNAAGCDSTVTLNLTIRNSTASSLSISAIGCYTWNANNLTYSVTGVYTATFLNTNNCDSIVTLNLVITPGVYLTSKVILSGPYIAATGLMYDSLRVNNLIPLTEPYSNAPYSKPFIGEMTSEVTLSSVLAVTDSNAIVDWIFIELRSNANPNTVIANKRALLQRDGDIVSHIDGVSPVFFPTVSNGNYFVSIKHRNHFGVMSASALPFNGCSSTILDLTTSSPVYTNPLITNAPRKIFGSVYALWSGDANNNKNIKYNGLSNDKDAILTSLGGSSNVNGFLSNVYRVEDCNMDGKVKFNNSNNDRLIILDNVGVSTPNMVLSQHTPN